MNIDYPNTASRESTKRRPLVGIVTSTIRQPSPHLHLAATYPRAVTAAGCLPILIPLVNELPPQHLLRSLNAMIFPGGTDINPLQYGHPPRRGLRTLDSERDRLESRLLQTWLQTGRPLLGIGRGMQLLMTANGGTLHQHLPASGIDACCHEQTGPLADPCHSAEIAAGSTLAQWMEIEGECRVNSLHHQAVAEVAPGFRVSAVAMDGVIEAVEAKDGSPVLGVQWHPEAMPSEMPQARLFANLAAYCGVDSLLECSEE